MTEQLVNNLIINKLTKSQYAGAVKSPTELYFVTDVLEAQYEIMPTADATVVGSIVQYIGTTDANYTNGYFYKCVNNSGVYSWSQITVQQSYAPFPGDFVTSGTLQQVVTSIKNSSGRGRGRAYLGTISGACMPGGSGNGECKVEYMTDNIAVLTLNSSNNPPYTWVYNTDASNLTPADYTWKKHIVQYTSDLPTRDVPDGTVVQYAGETTANYTKGYFYKANTVGYTCTWEQINVQPGSVYTAGDRITITNNTISADIQYGAQFVDWSEQ